MLMVPWQSICCRKVVRLAADVSLCCSHQHLSSRLRFSDMHRTFRGDSMEKSRDYSKLNMNMQVIKKG